jgi:hypothetical protein
MNFAILLKLLNHRSRPILAKSSIYTGLKGIMHQRPSTSLLNRGSIILTGNKICPPLLKRQQAAKLGEHAKEK